MIGYIKRLAQRIFIILEVRDLRQEIKLTTVNSLMTDEDKAQEILLKLQAIKFLEDLKSKI